MSRYGLTLSFRGPVHSAGEATIDLAVDRTMARDASHRLVLPASHVRGRLREALTQVLLLSDLDTVKTALLVSTLFGDAQRVGALGVSDFVLGTRPAPAVDPAPLAKLSAAALVVTPQAADMLPVHALVAIDRRYGRARDQALAFRESPGHGVRTDWSGWLSLPASGAPPLSLEEGAGLLALAVRWLDTLGSSNNTGWGWLCEKRWHQPVPALDPATVPALAARAAPPADDEPAGDEARAELEFMDVAVVLHGPVLCGEKPRPGNYQESPDHLPGGVIKRALADVIAAAQGRPRNQWINPSTAATAGPLAPLAAVLGAVQVRHALPVDAAALDANLTEPLSRPLAIPLTALRSKGDDEPHGDALLPLLREAWPTGPRAGLGSEWLDGPVWQLWQRDDRPGVSATPLRLVRTRTSVDGSLRAARDGALFTNAALDPITKGRDRRQAFLCRLGYPGGAPVRAALEVALGRVERIGKAISAGLGAVRCYQVTGREDTFHDRLTCFQERLPLRQRERGFFAPVSLNSDALLLPQRGLADRYGHDLRDLYEGALRALVLAAGGPEVRLEERVGFLADHRLRGHRGKAGPLLVPPVVLTAAGSVFLLQCSMIDEQRLRQALAQLARDGLTPKGQEEEMATLWGPRQPYRTDCGFGEIIICHPMHLQERAP